MPRTWTDEDRAKARKRALEVQMWKHSAHTGAKSEDGKRRAAQRGRKTGLRGLEGLVMRRWLASLNRLCKALAARDM